MFTKVNCGLDIRIFLRFCSVLDVFYQDSFGLLRVGMREMLQLIDLLLTQLIQTLPLVQLLPLRSLVLVITDNFTHSSGRIIA